MTELAERGPSLARRLRRGVKEPAQRAFAWAAVRGLDTRQRAVTEVAAMEPRAIVAVRTDRIGDLLVSTPLVAALHRRWPSARLVVIAGPKNRAVLDGLPFVEPGPVFRRTPASWLALGRWLGAQRFDLAVSLRAEGMSGVFVAAASRAPVRLVTHATKTAPAFNCVVGVEDLHHVTRHCRAAALLGAPCPEPRPVYEVPAAERARAGEIARSRWSGDARVVGVQVPSRGDRRHTGRAWPAGLLAELVSALATRGYRVALFGVGREREEAERIRGATPRAELVPSGTLAFAAALLAHLDVFVSGFTGTHHLADAVGTPTVVVGAAHQAIYWRSLGPAHRLAVAEQAADVPVERVLAAVEDVLAARGPRG
jgi:heptosyltransferase-2/heptosyltransferase-3